MGALAAATRPQNVPSILARAILPGTSQAAAYAARRGESGAMRATAWHHARTSDQSTCTAPNNSSCARGADCCFLGTATPPACLCQALTSGQPDGRAVDRGPGRRQRIGGRLYYRFSFSISRKMYIKIRHLT
jgi:dihydroxyacid dehydratase/phosphogluconate dehydratase